MDAPDYPTIEDLKSLIESLQVENGQPVFGEATRKLVQIFQIQEGLGDSRGGMVEEKTAALLNALLAALGAFDPTENDFVVKGVIRRATGIPYGG